MDSILALFREPAWWFEKLVMPLVVLSVLKWLGAKFLTYTRHLLTTQARRLRFRYQKKVRIYRRSDYQVHHSLVRAGSNYTVFLLAIVAYYFALILFPAFSTAKITTTVLLLVPIIFLEFAWLLSESFAKSLFSARQRLLKNVRSKSTGVHPIIQADSQQ
jgi:hypothetical protein